MNKKIETVNYNKELEDYTCPQCEHILNFIKCVKDNKNNEIDFFECPHCKQDS